MAMSQARKSLVTMLVLLLVAGGVGAYAYFGVYKTGLKEDEQKGQDAKIFAFDKARVKSVSLTVKGKGAVIKFDKVDDQWQIVSPIQARADKSKPSKR